MIDAWARVHYGLAALTWKQLLAIGIPAGGSVAALLEQLVTGNWGSAGLAGVIGAMFMTVMLVTPRLIEQRRKNRESDASISDGKMEKFMQRLERFYEGQITYANTHMGFYRKLAVERDLQASMERNSKHKYQSQLTGAETVIQVLLIQLVQASIEPKMQYHAKTYEELAGEEDKAITESKNRCREAVDNDSEAAMSAVKIHVKD